MFIKRNKHANKKGGLNMYGIADIEDLNHFKIPRFDNNLANLWVNLKLRKARRTTQKRIEMQNKLIENMEESNHTCSEFLKMASSTTEKIASKLTSGEESEYIYSNYLTALEKLLDKTQDHLIKIKTILDDYYLKDIKSNKLDEMVNITNRNLNLISTIKDSIADIDNLTNNTRYYTKIKKKYNIYNIILFITSIFCIALSFLNSSLFPRYLTLAIAIIPILGMLELNKDKKITMLNQNSVNEEYDEE